MAAAFTQQQEDVTARCVLICATVGQHQKHRLGVTAHTLNPTLRMRLHSSTTHSALCNNNYTVTVTRIFKTLYNSRTLNQPVKLKKLAIMPQAQVYFAPSLSEYCTTPIAVCSTSLNWGTVLGHTSCTRLPFFHCITVVFL